MAVLSDARIRQRMAEGKLIIGGDPQRAKRCGYHCSAGKIFPAGDPSPAAVVDWTAATVGGLDSYVIEPRAMVWVRTVETVAVPPNLCAFWWQTNTLSRLGLMLVNSTMVEPGYNGPLACLFVNFGKHRVLLSRDTIVAKLVFSELDQVAVAPFEPETDSAQYDHSTHQAALLAPATFLHVADMIPALDERKQDALAEIARSTDGRVAEVTKRINEVRDTAVERFRASIPQELLKLAGGAAVGFLVLLLALSFVPWLQTKIEPDISSKISAAVEQAIAHRTVLPTTPSPGETALRRIETLELRLTHLEDSLHHR